MPPAAFETTIPESEGPQTKALDRAATGIGISLSSNNWYTFRLQDQKNDSGFPTARLLQNL